MQLFTLHTIFDARPVGNPAPPVDPPPPSSAVAPMYAMTWHEEDGPGGAEYRYPTASGPDLVTDCTTGDIRRAPSGRRVWFDGFAHTDLWEFDKCINPSTGLPTPYRWLIPTAGIAAMKQRTLDAIATWQSQGISEIDFISIDAETRYLKDKITTAWQQALVADERWETELLPLYNEELRRQSGNPDAEFRWDFQGGMIGAGSVSLDMVHNSVFWGNVNDALREGYQDPVNAWCGRAADHPEGRHFVGIGNYENSGAPVRRDLDVPVVRETGWVYADKQPMNRMRGVSPAMAFYCTRGQDLDGVGTVGEEETGGSAWLLWKGQLREVQAARAGADLDPDAEGKGMAPGGENEIAVAPWAGYYGAKYTIAETRYRSTPDPISRSLTQEVLQNPYHDASHHLVLMASGQYEGRITPARKWNSRTGFSTGAYDQLNDPGKTTRLGDHNSNNYCDRGFQACLAEHRSLVGDTLPRHPVDVYRWSSWFAGSNGLLATLTDCDALCLRGADGRGHYLVGIERKAAPMIPDPAVIATWQEVQVAVKRGGVQIDTLTVPAGRCFAFYSDSVPNGDHLTFEVINHETAPDLVPSGIKDLSTWLDAGGSGRYSSTALATHPITGGGAYKAPSSGGSHTVFSPLFALDCAPGELCIAHIYLQRFAESAPNVNFAVLDSAGEELASKTKKPASGSMGSRYERFFAPDDLLIQFRLTAYRDYACDVAVFAGLTTPALSST